MSTESSRTFTTLSMKCYVPAPTCRLPWQEQGQEMRGRIVSVAVVATPPPSAAPMPQNEAPDTGTRPRCVPDLSVSIFCTDLVQRSSVLWDSSRPSRKVPAATSAQMQTTSRAVATARRNLLGTGTALGGWKFDWLGTIPPPPPSTLPPKGDV